MSLKHLFICLFLPGIVVAQTPSSILKYPLPPDISESYRANPHFYEIMTGFPDNNSYYKYDFEEVKKNARNDAESMVILGDHYRIGRSTPADLKKALKEYHRAATKGSAKANHRIAYMYADGLDLPRDQKMILEYLHRSAAGGYAPAQYDCALIYLNGKFDQPRDPAKAYPFLQKASAQGHKNATELLAMLAFHPASQSAGIPAGLEPALRYFRLAGDSDGEKALLMSISTFGGLRYYLRTIPGFIPGIELPADPADAVLGPALLRQLMKNQSLTGEQNYRNYRKELAENILYKAYFASQSNREALLRFILFCYRENDVLGPENQRYIEAASRDFRLTVLFSSEKTLEPYLSEFDLYPGKFNPDELPVVADRIFVALYLRESPELISEKVEGYLFQRAWITSQLSAKYALTLENDRWLKVRHNIITNPYQAVAYINGLFERLGEYNSEASDTLLEVVLPQLRNYCLHPALSLLLSDQLHQSKNNQKSLLLQQGTDRANTLIREDINRYFEAIALDPAAYAIDPLSDPPPKKLAGLTRKTLIMEGEAYLDSLCTLLPHYPQEVLTALDPLALPLSAALQIDKNFQRTKQLTLNSWSKLLAIKQINCKDPNGVELFPETVNYSPFTALTCPGIPAYKGILLKNNTEVLYTWKITVINHSMKEARLKIAMNPIYSLPIEEFSPWNQNLPVMAWQSEEISIAPLQEKLFTFEIVTGTPPQYWQPLLIPEGQDFILPYLLTD